jgi:hypothetical protein
MKPGFYIGSLVIVSSILLNGYLMNGRKDNTDELSKSHTSDIL